MDNSLFSLLCGIYGRSELPSAVVQGEKIYKNEGFEKLLSSFGEEDRRRFTEVLTSSEGAGCGFFGGRAYSFNVIKEQELSIIEVTGSNTIEKTLQIPAVREYLEYFFSKLRSSVAEVSVAADGIYGALSAGGASPGRDVTDKLNAIDGRLADIISSVIDPEQLLYLTGETAEDHTVSLKDELTAAAEDLKSLFGGQAAVNTDLEAGIYARLNRKAFRTIIADAVAECCRGNVQLKCINIALHRLEDGSAEAALTAEYASGAPCGTNSGSFGEDVFFDYVTGAFCKRYGGSFTRSELPCGKRFVLTFPAINLPHAALSSNTRFGGASGRFDPICLRLRDISGEVRYRSYLDCNKN